MLLHVTTIIYSSDSKHSFKDINMDADLYLLVYCVFLIGVSKAILDAAGPTVEHECTILGKDLSKG